MGAITITYKIPLFPTKEQEKLFYMFSGASRFVYNWSLAFRDKLYKEDGSSCTVQYLIQTLAELRDTTDEFAWLKQVPEAVTKQAIKDMDTAYRNFFKGNAKFPKFKKKSRTTPTFYHRTDKCLKWDGRTVSLLRVGKVKCNNHHNYMPTRPLNPRIKFDGKYWYLTVSEELDLDTLTLHEGQTSEIIGIDVGVKSLAVCSNEYEVKPLHKDKTMLSLEKRLKRLQRSISRSYEMNKDGNTFVKTSNCKKKERKLTLLHRRIRNYRETYLHTATQTIAKTKPFAVVLETLDIKGMMKNRHLSKALATNSLFTFTQMLSYKLLAQKSQVIRAPKTYASSKLCSCCGFKKEKLSLSERTYECKNCGHVQDRDLNASHNLRNYGQLILST